MFAFAHLASRIFAVFAVRDFLSSNSRVRWPLCLRRHGASFLAVNCQPSTVNRASRPLEFFPNSSALPQGWRRLCRADATASHSHSPSVVALWAFLPSTVNCQLSTRQGDVPPEPWSGLSCHQPSTRQAVRASQRTEPAASEARSAPCAPVGEGDTGEPIEHRTEHDDNRRGEDLDAPDRLGEDLHLP